MKNSEDIRRYIFAGHGSFTIESGKTGRHYTYRVRHPKGKPWFVSLLTAPDTYSYLGWIPSDRVQSVRLSDRSCAHSDAPSVLALNWVLSRTLTCLELQPNVIFRHNGHCCRCGRELTTPESIDRGIGPICLGKM